MRRNQRTKTDRKKLTLTLEMSDGNGYTTNYIKTLAAKADHPIEKGTTIQLPKQWK